MFTIKWIIGICLACLCGPALAAMDTHTINWQPVIGQHIPVDLQLRDENDKAVTLADYFGKRPVILMLGYFKCQSLCPEIFAGTMQALHASHLTAGRDYELIAVSIDSTDDAQTAKLIKQHTQINSDDAEYTHFLTASEDVIASLTKALGFNYSYDSTSQQFAHPAGLIIFTQDGVINQYLPGIRFTSAQMRDGVLKAKHSDNVPISTIQYLRLLCYHLDVQTGRHTLAVMRLMQFVGVTGVIVLMWLWYRQRKA